MYTLQQADLGSLVLFELVIIFVLSACLWGLYKTARGERLKRVRTSVRVFSTHVLLPVALFSAAVASGVLSTDPFPGIPILFVLVLGYACLLPFTKAIENIGNHTTLTGLLGFQFFRLPLEWVLHLWAKSGVIPETMTWTGQNWDVLTPLSILAGLFWVERSRAIAWTVNSFGFLLLLNVMRVAVCSSPVPFGWEVQPKLLLMLELPYAWIVPICVGGALVGHILVFRRLFQN